MLDVLVATLLGLGAFCGALLLILLILYILINFGEIIAFICFIPAVVLIASALGNFILGRETGNLLIISFILACVSVFSILMSETKPNEN